MGYCVVRGEEAILVGGVVVLEPVEGTSARGDGTSVGAVVESLKILLGCCPWVGGIQERRIEV